MTIEEIREKIQKYEESDFFIQMADHWSSDDYEAHDMYRKKILELKKLAKEAGYDIENQEDE